MLTLQEWLKQQLNFQTPESIRTGELLEVEGDKIDSVQVATPDHMHASVSIAAMKRKKHVYCEKPLAHEISEARAMGNWAKKSGVVTQMGNQIQSSIEYRSAVVLLQNGVIGKIKEVHAWSGASFPGNGRPAGEDPVPKNLDWDKWLGVAPVRPYKGGVYHPFNWRGWQDFGTGPIGDFMCHIMDSPFKALELTAPKSVIATGVPSRWANDEKINTENWPEWATYDTFSQAQSGQQRNLSKFLGMMEVKSHPENLLVLKRMRDNFLEVVVYLLESQVIYYFRMWGSSARPLFQKQRSSKTQA